MGLSQEQVARYRRDGFLALDSVFGPEEVKVLRDAFERDCTHEGPHRVMEDGGSGVVRAIYATHHRQPEYTALVRERRVLGSVRQLLTDDVYVYQCKVNTKIPDGGEKWSWHQDYPAWRIADNLPYPRQVNVAVFLDDVNEFNGPVVFVPGSHRAGAIDVSRKAEARSVHHLDPDDIALTSTQIAPLVDRHGMHAPKGPAGSVVFFSPQVVHGSTTNMSPYPRRLVIVTYNDVTNLPSWSGERRPDYLVGRETDPLEVLDIALTDVARCRDLLGSVPVGGW